MLDDSVSTFSYLSAPMSIRMANYKNLEIWQLSRELTTEIHRMTLTKLPNFERYEEGSQIRRSSKSVRSAIVEGYGRRMYKAEFIRFLVTALASNDETIDHPEILQETGSLTDDDLFTRLHETANRLGKKLQLFIAAVERQHQSPK